MEGATYQPQIYGSVHSVVAGDNPTVTNIYQYLSPTSSYRNILGSPPVANPDTIQQRIPLVNTICAELTQSNLNALILTGVGGIGKSTLASLVYKFAEDQQQTAIFKNPPLWLQIDATTTFADIAGTICQVLKKPLPELSSLSPASQAHALHSTLSTASSQLIVLDQFECFLDWETGEILPDRPGISEWLDALSSKLWTSGCRLLFTCRTLPKIKHIWLNIREFQVKGLEMIEGIELLQKLGVQAPETDLQDAVKRCDGHAFALIFLQSILSIHKIALHTVLINSAYSRRWKGNIAKKMLDHIYKNQLNDIQKKLLLAFSIYREPVQSNAVLSIIPEYSEDQVLSAIEGLFVQHLVQVLDNGYYQLHSLIANYVEDQFDTTTRYAAHEKAAWYYQQKSKAHCPPFDNRRSTSDVYLLIETMWQFCQANQWKQAYDIMMQERLFLTLKRCGANTILLGLLEALLPTDNWHPNLSQRAYIYTYLGDVYKTLGQMTEAYRYFEQAWSICKDKISHEIEGDFPCVWALSNLGRYYSIVSNWERAKEYFEHALDTCRAKNNQGNDTSLANLGDQITTLNDLGGVYQKQRKKKIALDNYEQALILSKEIGDLGKQATTLKNIGDVYRVSKATRYKKKALEYYTKALNIQKELGIRGQEALTLSSLGTLYSDSGEKRQALDYFKQALNICKEVGDRLGESRILSLVGMIHLERESYQLALACLLTANDFFELIESKEQVSVKAHIEGLCQQLCQENFDQLLIQVQQNKRQIIEEEL